MTTAYRFGPFELQPNQRRLLNDGHPVELGHRAFDVLSVLVEESAYLVTLSLPDRGVAFRHLSAYDVGRSLRGDPDALAVLRADLLRDVPCALHETAAHS